MIEEPISYEKNINLFQLLGSDTERFTEVAYDKLFHRMPDEAGRQTYSIKDNKIETKIDILCRLITSQEGVAKKVSIKGLLAIKHLFASRRHTFEKKEIYGLEDYLFIPHEDLPKKIFLSLLNRLPTEQEETEAKALIHSKLSILRLLIKITYSPEGQSLNVSIKNKRWLTLISKMSQIPAIGKVMSPLLEFYGYFIAIKKIESSLIDQIRFNQKLTSVLSEMIEITADSISEQALSLKKNLLHINRRIMGTDLEKSAFIDQLNHNNCLINTLLQSQNIQQSLVPIGHSPSKSNFFDDFYVAFEKRFRGDESSICQKMQSYLPLLEALKKSDDRPLKALDIGCGRGEWISLLKKDGFETLGIDLNTAMIEHCQSKSLNCQQHDALLFLKESHHSSFDLISSFHLIEHLSFESMMQLFLHIYRVLTEGGLLLLETPNPENILTGSCYFYNDPTHKNPIPPKSLEFYLQYIGFENIRTIRSNPSPKIVSDPDIQRRFFGAQDYAILAKKPIDQKRNSPSPLFLS